MAPDNIHLTLAFLGVREAAGRSCIDAAAAQVQGQPFTIEIDRLGCWARSGILWAGMRQAPDGLHALVQSLNDRLAACDYRPEDRPYLPHMTLVRGMRPCVAGVDLRLPAWEVDRFHLACSHTRAAGARYEIVRTWRLAQAEPGA